MMLLEHDMLAADSMPTLRLSLFCGEPLPVSLAAAWQAAAPNSIIENLYGPTELTLACTAYRWRGEESLDECVQHLLPIGHAFPGLEAIVVDGELEDVDEGVVGELCVAGPQTFAGYWQDSAASRNAFLIRHAADGAPLRFYRTGDLVARRNNVFSFCGRNDGRVKIHGYRIELGQIEGEMRAAGYAEAIALAWPDNQHPRSILLVVYEARDSDQVLADARSRLPAYMIPAQVVRVAEIPTNVNGKIDRIALRNRVREIIASHAKAPGDGAPDELDLVIAKALEIAPVRLSDELSLNSMSKWDSLGHAQLMMALEAFTGREVSPSMIDQLTSVRAIRRFVQASDLPDRLGRSGAADEAVHRGLAGLVVERSAVSRVDGGSGTLEYSGYNIDELFGQSSFEEVFWLLLHGELPNASELARFRSELAGYRTLPGHIVDILGAMAHAPPAVVLRTAVSALPASPDFASSSLETGLRIFALLPVIIATHDAMRRGAELPSADPSLSHAANFAQMLFGKAAPPHAARFIEQDLILHADHEANASTFTARLVIGCEAGLTGAVTAAIAAFLGERHGGAVEMAARMFDEIGEPSRAAEYVRDRKRVMGFGHRVYRVEDPRVRHTRALALSLSGASGDMRSLQIADALVAAMSDRAKFGIAPNVDLYAAVAYRCLGIADDLGTVLGAAGRVAGWVAHAMEQQRDNVLVRPRLKYIGARSRKYPRSRED
jgi:citrate synthase